MSCDEAVQRANALLQAAFDLRPFFAADDPRQNIERPNFLQPGFMAIHVERDAHVPQGTVGRFLMPLQLGERQRLKPANQRLGPRPGSPSEANVSS